MQMIFQISSKISKFLVELQNKRQISIYSDISDTFKPS